MEAEVGADVGEGAKPLTVLFVCTANICRSAFADRLAHHLLDDDESVHVASAGTYGWVDHPVEDLMAEQLQGRGIEPDGFASRKLTWPMVEEAGLILTMTMPHRQFILDDRPLAVWRMFTLGQFARILEDLPEDLHGADLVRACRTAHKPARPEDDVSDPYGRGPERAALAAEHIEGLLQRILPRLKSPRDL